MKINYIPFLLGLTLVAGCDTPGNTDKRSGTIRYSVELPFVKENFLTYFFPKEMVVEFDGQKTRTTIETSQGIGRTEIISDNDARSIKYLFKHFDSTYVMTMDSVGVAAMLRDFPVVRLEATDETEMVAGFNCKRTIAHFETDSLPAIELLHTSELDLGTPNWYTQFFGIDEVLMAYDIEQFGIRTRMRATSVEFAPVRPETFAGNFTGKTVEWPEMKGLIDNAMRVYRDTASPNGR